MPKFEEGLILRSKGSAYSHIFQMVRFSRLYTARVQARGTLTAITECVTNYNKLIGMCLIATNLHVLLMGL